MVKLTAKQVAVNILSRRDHSEYELRTKLQTRDFASSEIDEAILFCFEHRWLDDGRYSELVVRSGISKGHGLYRIKQTLKQKGVENQIIEIATQENDQDWFELAKETLARRFSREIDSDKEKARRIRFLQSRGFNFDQINYALNGED
ncbi:recombination regulator RecX [Vibrio sp. SS-MA-C1-2]|uniref:recombination regulator RecX n=1 Tax=Vibrio sp. SS-MA-C1-2 TaxID=2908646 RepID=UPI001F3A5C93|nr:recombination regulator RecX [Vibrio sp. SS-MA-C1-2]UJF19013.1 recombination regulator RecX [Vibrio sp. SS-MA-C1-2]